MKTIHIFSKETYRKAASLASIILLSLAWLGMAALLVHMFVLWPTPEILSYPWFPIVFVLLVVPFVLIPVQVLRFFRQRHMSSCRAISLAVASGFITMSVYGCCTSEYAHERPFRLGSVEIPEIETTISLITKSQPKALFGLHYEGSYRILEVTQRGKQTLYYELFYTFPGDRCQMHVFWHPEHQLVRVHDLGFSFAAQQRVEALVDLKNQAAHAVIRHRDEVYIAPLPGPMLALEFPDRYEGSRVTVDFQKGMSRSDNEPWKESVRLNNAPPEPIDAPWTREAGQPVGVIVPTKGSTTRL